MTLEKFDPVARTALLTTALRGMESARPDRLYNDPYAGALAGVTGQALFDEVARTTLANRGAVAPDSPKLPSTFDYNAIRTRFLDDWLTTTLAEGGFDQVVIAAAGMDTRAYRLAWPHPVQVFEIDRAAVLDLKEAALAGHPPSDGVTRHLVRADLVVDDWQAELASAGFDRDRPAVWLLEGLFYYLSDPEVHTLLAELQELCLPGSPVACDLVNQVALTAPAARPLLGLFSAWGSPWVSGADEPEQLMAAHGFEVTAVQPGEPGADYGRWRDPVIPRHVAGIPRVFYVYGRRAQG
jgi:methyltransferase (TIGR00027 family)